MKNTALKLLPSLVFALLLTTTTTHSQIAVTSTTGYAVNVTIIPVAILPSTTNCPWGYNYNLRLNYVITFSGNNIPSSLNTLQGYIVCGSNTHFFDLPNNGGAGTVNSTSNQWSNSTNCQTATIASLLCNTVRIEIGGPGISARTVSFPMQLTPLPVTTVDFRGDRTVDGVLLKWTTVSETDNDYFTIERSTNGIDWMAIGTTQGAGTSTARIDYSYTDAQPLSTISYYRLRQTDFNGAFLYSSVVSMTATTVSKISIYPVPNSGRALHIKGLVDYSHAIFQLYNMQGVKLMESAVRSSQVELPAIPKGVYMVSINNTQTGESERLRYVQL